MLTSGFYVLLGPCLVPQSLLYILSVFPCLDSVAYLNVLEFPDSGRVTRRQISVVPPFYWLPISRSIYASFLRINFLSFLSRLRFAAETLQQLSLSASSVLRVEVPLTTPELLRLL
jgi:hypothetical protein